MCGHYNSTGYGEDAHPVLTLDTIYDEASCLLIKNRLESQPEKVNKIK